MFWFDEDLGGGDNPNEFIASLCTEKEPIVNFKLFLNNF